jgi:YidC/Oxa1 family membrane protein insertase
LETNRLIIAVLIAMGVLFLYQEFLQWRYPELYGSKAKHNVVTAPATTSNAGTASPPAAAPSALTTPAAEDHAPAAPVANNAANGTIAPFPEHLTVVSTDYFEATLSNRGGRVTSFKLKNYRATAEPDSPEYQMIRNGDRMPIGMVVVANGVSNDDADIDYSSDSPSEVRVGGGTPTEITFKGTTSNGIKLEKTFTFRDSTYVFDVTGRATLPDQGTPGAIGLTLSQPLAQLPGYRDVPEVQAYVQGKIETGQEKAVQKGMAPASGLINFAGFGDRYFLSAFLPTAPRNGTFAVTYADHEADAQILFNKVGQVSSRVFMGPKELNLLEAADPALSKAIDLGWWGAIAIPFLRLLKIFYRIIPNYGVAIILLTILVRVATLPLAVRGQRSMMRMQRLQPQVTKIREKFKDDSERLNREMVDLYKRNHVNPLGGCIPMVIQFPVMIALYEALLNAVDLRNAPFIGWIRDLSAPDCLHVSWIPEIPYFGCHGIPALVLLMTVSTFLQQWLMPKQADPSQQKMMMIMPIVFSIMFLNFPSGLTLYYFVSNLLGIAQQVILNKEFQQITPETAK